MAEERQAMTNCNLPDASSIDQMPSLVKMSSTLINQSDISISSTFPSNSLTELSQNDPMPNISDTELPSSFIYRLNYFSSNNLPSTLTSFKKSPKFYCHSLCRRDEIEQHCQIHSHIDCILNTSLFQQCPKSQYGCKFQYERLEPCQLDGRSIRIRFDQKNDAIAFEWYPVITNHCHDNLSLLHFPTEILENILQKLDSLSLRNVSVVCHVRILFDYPFWIEF